MLRQAPAIVLSCAVLVAAVQTPVTLAAFASSKTATGSFRTGSIAPPTALVGTGGTAASLSWTPSVSSSATGYLVLRSGTSGSGYTQVKTVTPISAASTTDSPGAGTWYYVLDTYLDGWTSANSNEASITIGPAVTTAYTGCASQQAETTNAGDNNGYEGDPTYGCVKDSRPTVDASTGTNTNLECADSGKDRERFWGYTFALPATVSSVAGVSVQLVMGLNNNSGTSRVCVELSWDGGTSWTAPKTASIAHVPLQAYTLGSSTDTWGHAGWTAAQLSSANFRVRLTDMSSVTSKDFQLDYVGVSVGYTP